MTDSSLRGDEGQLVPMLALVIGVFALAIVWFAQVGMAGALRVGGQSAADAAALAAVAQLREEAIGLLRNPPPSGTLPGGVYGRMQDEARDYAQRNGARLQQFEANLLEARVEVDTHDQLEGSAADRIGVSGRRGEATARARLTLDWRLAPATPRFAPPLGEAQIEAIADRNGFDYDELPATTALRGSGRSCTLRTDPDVGNLNARMHDVIIRLEMAEPAGIGGALSLASAYRCPTSDVLGLGQRRPDAYGDAFRTTDAHRGAVAGRMSTFQLCRPYANDANLFAHRDGALCGGQTGDLPPGQAHGGLGNLVRFDARLIPDEGPLGVSGP